MKVIEYNPNSLDSIDKAIDELEQLRSELVAADLLAIVNNEEDDQEQSRELTAKELYYSIYCPDSPQAFTKHSKSLPNP